MPLLFQKILPKNVFHLLDKILLLLKTNILLLLFLNIMHNYMKLNLSIYLIWITFSNGKLSTYAIYANFKPIIIELPLNCIDVITNAFIINPVKNAYNPSVPPISFDIKINNPINPTKNN